MKLDASDPFVLVKRLAEDRSVDQNSNSLSGSQTANTIMKIGLLVGVVLFVAGGFLMFLNLTGNETPSFVNARGGYTGLVQGGVLVIVGLVISFFFVIGLTGKPEEESSSTSPQRGP